MKKITFTLILILSWFSAMAQKSITLNHWEFQKQELGGVWEVWRNQEHEKRLWESVELPHCFNALDAVNPDVEYYQGEGWYRTFLTIDNPYKAGRTILHFEGAGQTTTLWLYDQKIGTHVGGYDEFSFDITEAVEKLKQHPDFEKVWKGKIPVAVVADNSRDLERIPSDLSDFFVYGGLYRKVHLEYEPQVSFQNVHILPELSADFKNAKVGVKTIFRNPDDLKEIVTAKFDVVDPSGKTIQNFQKNLDPTTPDSISFTLKKPELWTPNSPSLYQLKISFVVNGEEVVFTDYFGIRSFEFAQKGPFYLNGERLLLQGMHRHEDHAGVGAAMADSTIRRELKMIKGLGANFIRLGHYQQSELVLDLCDSLGLLVWEEIPWCRGGLGGEQYQMQAKNMLTNMINQHYNHPSIILWGLGNENDWPGDFETFDQEAIRDFMSELNHLAHQLDGSRKTSIRRCEFCADIVDVYSPSIWAGWYRGNYTDYKSVSEAERKKVDHFFHAEWGASQQALRHSKDQDAGLLNIASSGAADERDGDFLMTGGDPRVSRDGNWSESYACNLIDWHLKEQLTMDSLTGAAYWAFKDFATPLRPENPIPFMNQKGVVQRDLTPKESYYVFQSYWTEKPMAHIYGHTWTTRSGSENEKNVVKVYSNCTTVELFVNGVSYGVRERNPQDFPAAGLRWAVPFQAGENTIKAIGPKGSDQIVDEIEINYQTEKWGSPVRMETEIVERMNDQVLVKVKLVDDQNVLCLDARNRVRFSLSGDGKLIDNLGTIGHSRLVEVSNGVAYIYVQKNKGKSVLGITSDGIKTAFIEIE